MSEFLKTMSDAEVQSMKEHFYTLGWGQNETMWKCWNQALDYMAGKQLAEANKKQAETTEELNSLAESTAELQNIAKEEGRAEAQAQYDKLRGNYDHDLRIFKEHQTALEEAQARIKVLEYALVNAVIPLRGIDMRNHSELAKTEVLNAIGKIDAALSTTSPTEALDKVVRESVEKERERCAKVCELRYVGDNNREDMEAKRCAEAIRRIEP